MHLVADTRAKRNATNDVGPGNAGLGRGVFGWLMERLLLLCGGFRIGGVRVVVPRMLVLETLSIGPKKQLVLVRCEGEKYLIATGPETVHAMQRIESRDGERISVGPGFGERS